MKQKLQLLFIMAGLLFASSGVYSQEWKEVVVNGDFEGTDLSGFSINIKDGDSRNLEASDIVADDDDANNHIAKISFTAIPWKTQFVIQLAEPLSEGDVFKFSMRAKSSSANDIQIITEELGNLKVKGGEEWSTFTYEGLVNEELNSRQTITIIFARNTKKTDILYFDDISLKVRDGSTPIVFADDKVKEICVSNWDTNGDGELSLFEAASVTELGDAFMVQGITSFNEFQY